MKTLSAVHDFGGWWRGIVCAVACLALHSTPQAEIVGLPAGGMLDTETGLIWAPLQQPGTWQEAAAAQGPRYRLATMDQLATLFEHAGVEFGSGSSPEPDAAFDAANTLIGYWGCVMCQQATGAEFWLADAGPEGTHAMGSIFTYYDDAANEYAWNAFCCWFMPDDYFEPMTTGAAYVQVIPEPETAALVLLGIAALALRARHCASRR